MAFPPSGFELRNYSSLAALVFLLLEYLSNWHSEYYYIWRAPPTVVKYIYLIARYVGLVAQIVHYIFIHLFLVDEPVKPGWCRAWFIFLFGTCATTLASLDAILHLRVYALYSKDARVHFLAVPLALQFVAGVFIMERETSANLFDSQCDKATTPIEIGLMGGCVVLAHASLWVATFAKRNIAGGRAAVVRMVVREGAWILCVLVGIVGCSVGYIVASHSVNPSTVFVWPSAVISVITCRMILNMNQLKTEPPRGLSSTDFPLSTVESSVVDFYEEEI